MNKEEIFELWENIHINEGIRIIYLTPFRKTLRGKIIGLNLRMMKVLPENRTKLQKFLEFAPEIPYRNIIAAKTQSYYFYNPLKKS